MGRSVMRALPGAALACLALLRGACGQEVTGYEKAVPGSPDYQLLINNHWDYSAMGDLMPTQIRFSPGSDHVMVIFKQGVMRLYATINQAAADWMFELDLGPEVYDSFDHGLTAFAFDPDFPKNPLGYVLYGADAAFVGENNKPFYPNPNLALQATRPTWGNPWPYYFCPKIGPEPGQSTPADPGNYGGQQCEHWARIARIQFNPKTFEFAKAANVFTGQCGGSSTHGVGNLAWAPDGALTFSSGDNALYQNIDPGQPNDDACFQPELGMPQGSWRANRDDFVHGKIIALALADVRTGVDLDKAKKYTIVTKGLRNPFRHFILPDGTGFVGDVGYGDGTLTERIFTFKYGGAAENLGWPCNEGVRPYPWESQQDADRKAMTQTEGWPTCNGVYAAIAGAANADPNWRAPLFEYRSLPVDPNNAADCLIGLASITSIHVYAGGAMGAKYKNGLFFSDHTQKCMWYWPADNYPVAPANPAQANNQAQITPTLVLSKNGFVDITADPATGIMYLTDLNNARISSLSSSDVELPPPVKPVKPPPPTVEAIETCKTSPYAMPEVEWEEVAPGKYVGETHFDAFTYTTSHGTTRTRGYDMSIPGKVMRFEACASYEFTLHNDLDKWIKLFPAQGELNTLRDPGITNLHLHGMHISGMDPGDNQMQEIGPGEAHTYVYVIPCDHPGGTYWWHAHHHGSTALHAGGGAAAMLVLDVNPRVEYDMPAELKAITGKGKEALVFFDEVDVLTLNAVALQSQDPIWETDATAPYYLVNGCDADNYNAAAGGFKLDIVAGQWTRVRMLHQAIQNDLVVNFFSNAKGSPCEVGVLAKDGVYLDEVPRMLQPDNQKVYFTISSRVDVAIKCPLSTAGQSYTITGYQRIWQDGPRPMGKLTVKAAADGKEAAALPTWHPCRQPSLQDLRTIPAQLVPKETFNVYVRNDINDKLFDPNYMLPIDTAVGDVQEWLLEGTSNHPFHAHINHFQLQDAPANYKDCPDWHRAGDFVDTVTYANARARVRMYNDRYGGMVMAHCHVYTHSDAGVIAMYEIKNGIDALGSPATTNYGTCAAPKRAPYGGERIALPASIAAAEFDEGASNEVYGADRAAAKPLNPVRLDAYVQIGVSEDLMAQGPYEVAKTFSGEFLSYSVTSPRTAKYNVVLRFKGAAAPLNVAVKLDSTDCDTAEGVLAVWTEAAWPGTAGLYESLPAKAAVIPEGDHLITVCFNEVTEVAFSSITISDPQGQQPFGGTPASMPGTVYATNYDLGGPGVGYYDTNDAPAANAVRVGDGVDTRATVGNGPAVYNIAPGEWQSYTVNIREAGDYTVGMELGAAAAPGGFALKLKLDSKNCGDDVGTIFLIDDPAYAGTGTDFNFVRYFAPQPATIPKGQTGLHLLTVCWVRAPPALALASISFSLNGRPATVPYDGVPAAVPGVVQAANFDKPVGGFPGEGVAYHNINYDYADFVRGGRPDATVEVAAVGANEVAVSYIVVSEWLRYTVKFPAAGAYHLGLQLAAEPKAGPLSIMLKYDNTDCFNNVGALMANADKAYPGSGGFGQFAMYYPATGFTVTAAMAAKPAPLTLCLNAIPETGLQLMSLTIGAGAPPAAAVRTCYVEGCMKAPGVAQAENYDKGGEGLAFHNLPTPAGTPGNDVRPLEAVEAHDAAQAGNYVVDTIQTGEFTSYTIGFAAEGQYTLSLQLAGSSDAAVAAGGLAVSIQLDSINCADANATVYAFDDAAWPGTDNAVADLAFNGAVDIPAGNHIITVCWVRVPDGGGLLFDSFTFAQ